MNNNATVMNDKRIDEVYLQTLQKKNDAKRDTLKRAVKEYEDELEEMSLPSNDVAGNVGYFPKLSLADKLNAMHVELDLLHETKSKPEFPRCLENTDEPSESTQNQRLVTMYGEEILESYKNIMDMKSVLEGVLEREERKLRTKREFIEEQEELNKALHEELRRLKEAKQQQFDSKNNSTGDDPIQHQAIKDENQWIREQLKYVAGKLTKQPPVETTENPRKKKRHLKESSNTAAQQEKRNEMSMDGFVLELMNRLLSSGSDPYFFVARPTSDSDGQTGINEETLGLLQECQVVRPHPNNDRLLRLTDYRS